MIKFLILVIIIMGIYVVFIKNKNKKKFQQNNQEEKEEDKTLDTMIECKKCKTYVTSEDSILKDAQTYCCKKCAELE